GGGGRAPAPPRRGAAQAPPSARGHGPRGGRLGSGRLSPDGAGILRMSRGRGGRARRGRPPTRLGFARGDRRRDPGAARRLDGVADPPPRCPARAPAHGGRHLPSPPPGRLRPAPDAVLPAPPARAAGAAHSPPPP